MADDDLWKSRFKQFMLVRLFGVATFLAGIAIAYSDLLREGGWPVAGAIVAMMGAIDAVFAPRLMKRKWDKEDQERR